MYCKWQDIYADMGSQDIYTLLCTAAVGVTFRIRWLIMLRVAGEDERVQVIYLNYNTRTAYDLRQGHEIAQLHCICKVYV